MPLVYKALHGLAPGYLSDLIIPVADTDYHSRLRPAQRSDLVVPRVRLTTYGKRSLAFAAPTAWNMLSVQLRDNELSLDSFKCGLKLHLLSKHCKRWAGVP